MYEYKAKLIRYVDADTLELEVDLGFRMTFTDHFRLMGINTPEKRGDEKELGLKAIEFSNQCLPWGSELVIKTAKDQGKYGRWLVSIEYQDYDFTGTWEEFLVKEGYALEYDGTGPMPRFDPDGEYPIRK